MPAMCQEFNNRIRGMGDRTIKVTMAVVRIEVTHHKMPEFH